MVERTEVMLAFAQRASTFVLASLVAAACSPAEPPAPSLGIGVPGITTHLDPGRGEDPGTIVVAEAVFETVGTLASDWHVSADGKTWTATVAGGHVFSDGTPLDAAAIAANLNRWRADSGDPSPGGFVAFAYRFGASSAHPIVRADATERLHVRIVSAASDPNLPRDLAAPQYGIGSPGALARGAASFDRAPVGSGSYVVADWRRGYAVTMLPNPRARNSPAFASEIVRDIPDPMTTVLALTKDDVDVVYALPPAVLEAARSRALRTSVEAATGRVCAYAPFGAAIARHRCPP